MVEFRCMILALFFTYEMSFMKIYSSQIVVQFFIIGSSFYLVVEAGLFIITAM